MDKTFTFKDTDITVNRLGYGVMQLPGKGIWGPSADENNAKKVLKHVLESEVNLIDTADSYGPFFANLYIKDAIEANPELAKGKVIATKVGQTRQGPSIWTALGEPTFLRQQVELNLWSLGLETIDLMQLHRVDPKFTLAEQVGELAKMREEGKIKHIGLSEVTVDQLKEAMEIVPIVSVQNRYNLIDRMYEDVLDFCEENNIAFIPWNPINGAKGSSLHDNRRGAEKLLDNQESPIFEVAKNHNVPTSAVAISWLLKRSKVMLPIPGTSSIDHFDQNMQAINFELTDDEFALLSTMADV